MSRITKKQVNPKVDTVQEQKPKPSVDSSTVLNTVGSQPKASEVKPIVPVEPRIEVKSNFSGGQKRELVAMFRSDLSMDRKFDHLGANLKAIAYDCVHFHFEEAPITGVLQYKYDAEGNESPDFIKFVFEWTIPGLGHTFKIERKIPYDRFLRFV